MNTPTTPHGPDVFGEAPFWWGCVGATALTAAACWAGHRGLGIASEAGVVPLVLQGVLLGLMVLGFRSSRALPRALGRANAVTLLRTSLVALLVAFVVDKPALDRWPWMVVVLGSTALILDGVDGRLARRDGNATAFGGWFDQEVDGATVLVLSLLVWRSGAAGSWILLAGGLRYGFLLAVVALPRLREPLPYSLRRRAICVVQIAALVICLVPFVPASVKPLVALGSVLLLTASFAADIVLLWRTPCSFVQAP